MGREDTDRKVSDFSYFTPCVSFARDVDVGRGGGDRFASAEEIGRFVAVLLSQHAAGAGFMTGSDVVIDGGESPVFEIDSFHRDERKLISDLPAGQGILFTKRIETVDGR